MSETELEVGSTEDVEGIKLIDRHVLESVTHTHTHSAVLAFSNSMSVWHLQQLQLQLQQETSAMLCYLPSYLTSHSSYYSSNQRKEFD